MFKQWSSSLKSQGSTGRKKIKKSSVLLSPPWFSLRAWDCKTLICSSSYEKWSEAGNSLRIVKNDHKHRLLFKILQSSLFYCNDSLLFYIWVTSASVYSSDINTPMCHIKPALCIINVFPTYLIVCLVLIATAGWTWIISSLLVAMFPDLLK